MPSLAVLRLIGNPIVRTSAFPYRKTLISRCKQLKYLDDRPVFDWERRLVEAWARGTTREEKLRFEQEERERQHAEENEKQERNANGLNYPHFSALIIPLFSFPCSSFSYASPQRRRALSPSL